MKDEMSANLRQLIDGARGADQPTAADRDRVRAALVASLAAGGSTASGGGKLGLLGRVGLVALVGALLAGGAWWFASTSGGEKHPAPVAARPHPEAVPVVVPEPAALPPTPTADAAPVADAAPAIVETARPRRPAAPRDAAQLAEEARLLREAETARRAGELERAAQKLDEHRRRFPRGVLATEREAARVLLLCDAGRVAEARKLATGFLRRHPRSPLADRVRSACEESIP